MKHHLLLLPCLFLLFACSEKQGSKNETIQDTSLVAKIHSLVPGYNGSPEAKEKAKQKLQAIKDRIAKGEDFGQLAKQYSDDPGSAANGGNYDSLKPGAFVPEFDKIAFQLKPGEVSDIFETPYGFHIVMCRAKRGDEIDVSHILIVPK